MQTTAKWTRKELKQFITVFQWILEFSLEKVWLEVIIKHNKQDPDDMLDDINAKLIDVCEEYLNTHKLSIDKFQLATIVMDLYTKTISSLDEPFKVIAKESKTLVKEYLESNKAKRETLERIKNENDTLDKEIIVKEKELKEKKKASQRVESDFSEKPEMPAKSLEGTALGTQAPATLADMQKSKPKRRWTDALAIDNFRLPI